MNTSSVPPHLLPLNSAGPASNHAAPLAFRPLSPGSDIATPEIPQQPFRPRRRNGKIARLSEASIQFVNELLDQGLTYRQVQTQMLGRGVNLNQTNISLWYRGGYQDHLKALETRRLLLQLQERLLQFAASGKGPTLANVGVQISVIRLAHMVLELAPGPHLQTFQNDAREYLRLMNTLERLSKSQLAVQKYEDERAASQAAILPTRDPSRELTDQEMDLVASNLDKVFRRRRPSRPPASFAQLAPSAPDDVGL